MLQLPPPCHGRQVDHRASPALGSCSREMRGPAAGWVSPRRHTAVVTAPAAANDTTHTGYGNNTGNTRQSTSQRKQAGERTQAGSVFVLLHTHTIVSAGWRHTDTDLYCRAHGRKQGRVSQRYGSILNGRRQALHVSHAVPGATDSGTTTAVTACSTRQRRSNIQRSGCGHNSRCDAVSCMTAALAAVARRSHMDGTTTCEVCE